MLQRYLNLTAKLTDLQIPHKQLPSTNRQAHSHAGPIDLEHTCAMTLDQQEQQSSGSMASERPWGTAPDQQFAGAMASDHQHGLIADQQEQQSASRGATQPCSSGIPQQYQRVGRSYWQCKQEGGRYSRQWQELRSQQLFSNWMPKPEHLQEFIIGQGE